MGRLVPAVALGRATPDGAAALTDGRPRLAVAGGRGGRPDVDGPTPEVAGTGSGRRGGGRRAAEVDNRPIATGRTHRSPWARRSSAQGSPPSSDRHDSGSAESEGAGGASAGSMVSSSPVWLQAASKSWPAARTSSPALRASSRAVQ